MPALSNELRLGPPDKVDALLAQPEQDYTFVVQFSSADTVASARARDSLANAVEHRIELIDAVAANLKVARAAELARSPGVQQVWYLHPELAPLYVRTLRALDHLVKTVPLPAVANLSIGPEPKFWTLTHHDDPMNRALIAASERGLIPVIAIGNNPEAPRMPGWVSPWCRSSTVICVGAWDLTARKVADFSARGAPGTPSSWPTVVADGIDVIGPYPTHLTKSPARKARDESNEAFRSRIKREDWDSYTLESGTSQATALVSGAAAQVIHFLRETISRAKATDGAPLFSLTAPRAPTGAKTSLERLTGTARAQANGSVEYVYTLDMPWKMVKQILIDVAFELDAPVHEAGAGLIDVGYIREQFGQYGLADIKLYPTKVLER